MCSIVELGKVFEFLGVSPEFVPGAWERANVGRTPRSRLLRRILWDANPIKSFARRLLPKTLRHSIAEWLEAHNQRRVPAVPDRLRAELTPQFRADRARLVSLLGRSLPW
jgi:hypothetical protein